MRVLDLKLTDASEIALAAILNKNGRPLVFFSRDLQGIVSLSTCPLRKIWKHRLKESMLKRFFSTGRDFIVNTHQKSVFYMFDNHY